MNVLDSPGAVKQLRKTPWRFQQTFKTPLNRLDPFVEAIVLAGAPETGASQLKKLYLNPNIGLTCWHDIRFQADTTKEHQSLLPDNLKSKNCCMRRSLIG
jgi:hypothetical protein